MEKTMHFLILEDNPYDADLIKRELFTSKLNFTFSVVNSRKKYEEALNNTKPDIILSDYIIHEFDGVAAFQIMEKTKPGIPFIIVSGSIGEENSIELIKIGVTD